MPVSMLIPAESRRWVEDEGAARQPTREPPGRRTDSSRLTHTGFRGGRTRAPRGDVRCNDRAHEPDDGSGLHPGGIEDEWWRQSREVVIGSDPGPALTLPTAADGLGIRMDVLGGVRLRWHVTPGVVRDHPRSRRMSDTIERTSAHERFHWSGCLGLGADVTGRAGLHHGTPRRSSSAGSFTIR